MIRDFRLTVSETSDSLVKNKQTTYGTFKNRRASGNEDAPADA